MSQSQRAFGPTAVLTPANALSAARLVAAPAFAALILAIGPVSWLLWALWTVLATSDGLDGHLARRQGTTSSGAFLDPLADKVLVLCALSALASINKVSWIPVVLIGVREVAMSIFRVYASRRHVSIPARPLAKLKTFVQDVAIGLIFLPIVGRPYPFVGRDLLWAALALTLITGAEYYNTGRHLLHRRDIEALGLRDKSVV